MNNKLYRLLNWPEIEAIIHAENDNPFQVLGVSVIGFHNLVQCYCPYAKSVHVKIKDRKKKYTMERIAQEGFFALFVPGIKKKVYYFEVIDRSGNAYLVEDPYRFRKVIETCNVPKLEMMNPRLDFADRSLPIAMYEFLGAHDMEYVNVNGICISTLAENVKNVSVVGDFNRWDGTAHPMQRIKDTSRFVLFLPDMKLGERYLFECTKNNGEVIRSTDPFSFQMDEQGYSRVSKMNSFCWGDSSYQKNKKQRNKFIDSTPISILSLLDLIPNLVTNKLTKRLLADKEWVSKIINKCKLLNITHILMPISISPQQPMTFDMEIGTVSELKSFINELHYNNLGFVIEWNINEILLNEVTSVLVPRNNHFSNIISYAHYWVNAYHVDGFYMKGITETLSLHHKVPSLCNLEWYEREEWNSIAYTFFKTLNQTMYDEGILTIADNTMDYQNEYENELMDLQFSLWRKSQKEYSYLDDSIFRREHFIVDMDAEDKVAIGYCFGQYGKKIIPYQLVENKETAQYLGDLNRFYCMKESLHAGEKSDNTFEWISNLSYHQLVVWQRVSSKKDQRIMIVCNFSDEHVKEQVIKTNFQGTLQLLLDSDDQLYGGSGFHHERERITIEDFNHRDDDTIVFNVAAKSVQFWELKN